MAIPTESERQRRAQQVAFEWFAASHPHEAAEQDWGAFVAYARKRLGYEISEAELRAKLAETAEVE